MTLKQFLRKPRNSLKCLQGKHVEGKNFCPHCNAQIKFDIYKQYTVLSVDGELKENVIALSPFHAMSFFTHLYHRDNLVVDYVKTMMGMTVKQWRREMRSFIECVPEVTVEGCKGKIRIKM